ncbi:uncharacterized protein si:ch1073-220m6.1 [Puntigrus tetrazona]|uniref:uncharacterized protein si:ch1073-220m6.1 n=1 Tax=Puntigrus tetrazona TaxID=1606681 RepID=UPI001C8A0195|nr:uncharacterized protein si:ch1073-220m6.1 [Puntigrus tetrazona]
MKLILQWIFCFSLGFVTECQEKRYGLSGGSITLNLDLGNRSHLQDVMWRRFNRQELLANLKGVHPDIKRRMSLNVLDRSLTIHDLQENDSGMYEALDSWEKESLASYSLTVENNVSEPAIEVHGYNSSAGVCRATVNCSADGNWAQFDCDQHLCLEKDAFLTSVNITVTASDSVHCHARNHVSERRAQTSIMCHEKQQSFSRFLSPSFGSPRWSAVGFCWFCWVWEQYLSREENLQKFIHSPALL